MSEFFYQTYMIALPVILAALLGYIVWLLKEQKNQKKIDKEERDARIEAEKQLREKNSRGTMLLLRVQLIEYHDKYMELGEIPSYAYDNFNDMSLTWWKWNGDKNETGNRSVTFKESRKIKWIFHRFQQSLRLLLLLI